MPFIRSTAPRTFGLIFTYAGLIALLVNLYFYIAYGLGQDHIMLGVSFIFGGIFSAAGLIGNLLTPRRYRYKVTFIISLICMAYACYIGLLLFKP